MKSYTRSLHFFWTVLIQTYITGVQFLQAVFMSHCGVLGGCMSLLGHGMGTDCQPVMPRHLISLATGSWAFVTFVSC